MRFHSTSTSCLLHRRHLAVCVSCAGHCDEYAQLGQAMHRLIVVVAHHVKARTSRFGFSLSQAPTPPRVQLLLLRLLRSAVVATQRHRRPNPLVRATPPWPGGFVVAAHLLAPNSSSAVALFLAPLAAALVPDTARKGKPVPCCCARLLVYSPASAPPPPLRALHAAPGAPSALEAHVAAPPPCAPLLP